MRLVVLGGMMDLEDLAHVTLVAERHAVENRVCVGHADRRDEAVW